LRAWRARPRRSAGCASGRGSLLLAAENMASPTIGREVGCITGTASKWRVRYARDNGRALTGRSHDYKRHGTTTLFAALDIATARFEPSTIDAAGGSRSSIS
jgi:hypothetical protein